MKNSRLRKVLLLLFWLSLSCAIATLIETRFHVTQRGYDNFILDNRNHYLPCEDLPTKAEVERVMKQHADIVQQIQQIAPGFTGVEIDAVTCEGKADLLIWYGTHQQRIAVEEAIGAETFFGIPYRLQNR